MPRTITLSESAVAVLRFRSKGYVMPVTESNLAAFRELVAAGIMEADGSDFRFTPDGSARRHEILDEAEVQLRSLIPQLPDRIDLSQAAQAVLRGYLAGDQEVTDANRPAYKELQRAGIMMSVGTFTKGDDCVFKFTYRGWERRFEFAEMACAKESA